MDLLPQLRQIVFLTGTFQIAWAWALVYYALSHYLAGESPLKGQIGFGGQGSPQSCVVLLCQYFIVCVVIGILLSRVKGNPNSFNITLSTSLEFVPSPIFSGALSVYLAQFSAGAFRLGLLNLVATWVTAALVSLMPASGNLKAFGSIVTKTVGFGLGVAWNTLASKIEPISSSVILHTLYVLLMMILAASLAVPEIQDSSVQQRHASLLSFASRVVCAFALSDWLGVVMPSGVIGSIQSLFTLLVLAALLSGLVLQSDFEHRHERKQGAFQRILGWLVLVPCVWCCCPCVPLLWLLSGGRVGVKDRWLRLTADVCSLAASIVGTNLLTSLLDSSAASLGICTVDACSSSMFLLYAIVLAGVVSVILIVVLVPFQEAVDSDPTDMHFTSLQDA